MGILLSVAWVYYKKYTSTKAVLDFETQDVRNMATLPSETKQSEMEDVAKHRSKFSTLTENSSEI